MKELQILTILFLIAWGLSKPLNGSIHESVIDTLPLVRHDTVTGEQIFSPTGAFRMRQYTERLEIRVQELEAIKPVLEHAALNSKAKYEAEKARGEALKEYNGRLLSTIDRQDTIIHSYKVYRIETNESTKVMQGKLVKANETSQRALKSERAARKILTWGTIGGTIGGFILGVMLSR